MIGNIVDRIKENKKKIEIAGEARRDISNIEFIFSMILCPYYNSGKRHDSEEKHNINVGRLGDFYSIRYGNGKYIWDDDRGSTILMASENLINSIFEAMYVKNVFMDSKENYKQALSTIDKAYIHDTKILKANADAVLKIRPIQAKIHEANEIKKYLKEQNLDKNEDVIKRIQKNITKLERDIGKIQDSIKDDNIEGLNIVFIYGPITGDGRNRRVILPSGKMLNEVY